VVYLAMGWLAVRAALVAGAGRAAGPDEALRWVLRERHGPLVVSLVAGGLFADALLRFAEGWAGRSPLRRALSIGRGAAAAILGATAVRVERHVRGDGEAVVRRSVAWVLARSWGARALVAAGAAAAAVGIWEIFRGATGRPGERLRRNAMGKRPRAWAAAASRIGLAAHGALVAVIGAFLVRAGAEADPRKALDAGGALRRVERLPFGTGLLAAIAAGLMAWGASRVIRAFWGKD
jgi:hypothetical protein